MTTSNNGGVERRAKSVERCARKGVERRATYYYILLVGTFNHTTLHTTSRYLQSYYTTYYY
jgi:hypothetical protein